MTSDLAVLGSVIAGGRNLMNTMAERSLFSSRGLLQDL